MNRADKLLEIQVELMTLDHFNKNDTKEYQMLLAQFNRLEEHGAIGAFLGVIALLIAIPLLPVTIFALCIFDCGLKNYFKLLKQGYTNLYELGVSINK